MVRKSHDTTLGAGQASDNNFARAGNRELRGARRPGVVDTGIAAITSWLAKSWLGARLAGGGTAALPSGIIRLVMLAIVSAIYLSVSLSHTRLVEDRGVYDNICYLRQAHLFRTNGLLGGLDTDLPDARYIARIVEQSGLTGQFATSVPCHTSIPVTNKTVIQYPPGTGFLLSVFPDGAQATSLYLASSTIVFLLVCAFIGTARTRNAIITLGLLGGLTLYLMVNPAKATYSMAPTMPLCIALALATVRLFESKSAAAAISLAGTAGLIAGLAVDIRLSSALLTSGYAAVFATIFFRRPAFETFLKPAAFGAFMVVAALPTFAANLLNAGSPVATAYGGADASPPVFDLQTIAALIAWYAKETHGALNFMSIGAIIALSVAVRRRKQDWLMPVLSIAAVTFSLNLLYFLTHPIFSQYYTVPPAMLVLWIAALSWAATNDAAGSARERGGLLLAGSVAAAAACAAVTMVAAVLVSRPLATPSLALDKDAIVWVGARDWGDGTLAVSYRLDRYAAPGLAFLPADAQDRIISAVAADCRPQYFVAEDDPMKRLVARLRTAEVLQGVGQLFGAEVYRYGGCGRS
jgi:hypothetical protein